MKASEVADLKSCRSIFFENLVGRKVSTAIEAGPATRWDSLLGGE